jgi:hypothetical protein
MGTIKVVVDNPERKPIQDAVVTILDERGNILTSERTDKNGSIQRSELTFAIIIQLTEACRILINGKTQTDYLRGSRLQDLVVLGV